jgi:hypothetical protein
MRRAVLALALVAASVAVGPARAQRVSKVDGNKLLALCSGTDIKGCDAYLAGVGDAMAEEPAPRRACIPPRVTGTQLRDVVIKFLREEPAKRELSGGSLTVHAFAKAFPCHP